MFLKSVLFISFILSMPGVLNAQEIDLLILNRDYQQALSRIEQQLSSEPTAGLFFKKGLVCEKLMDFEGAISALRQACMADSMQTVYQEELAEAYSALGNYNDAALCLQRAAHFDPENLPLKGKLGQCFINLKSYREAYYWYDQIYKKDSANAYYNRYFAYAAFQTGKLDLAVRLYEQLVNQNSRDLNVYLNLAGIYANKKENTDKGEAVCSKGLRIFPEHPFLLLKWADVCFKNKEYIRAVVPFERYLAKNDSTYEVLKNYGVCLYFNRSEKKALSVLNKCYLQAVNDPIVNFYIGACYKNLKQFPESIEFFKLAIETATPFYLDEIYQHMGQAYGLIREYEKSIEAYQEALKLNPANVELLFEIATTYEEFKSNETMALNYYQIYLKEAGETAKRANYALDRIKNLKEDLFFEK